MSVIAPDPPACARAASAATTRHGEHTGTRRRSSKPLGRPSPGDQGASRDGSARWRASAASGTPDTSSTEAPAVEGADPSLDWYIARILTVRARLRLASPRGGFPNVGAVAPLSGGRIWGRTIYASAMVVQFADVLEIRRGWIKRGRPPCDHGRLAGERYLGADTGDDACLDCGEEFSRSDRTPTKDRVSES